MTDRYIDEWVTYRHHEGWCATGYVHRKKPTGRYVVSPNGEANSTTTVPEDNIIRKEPND